jgi:hypothetical protein
VPSSLPPELERALIALAARLDGVGVDWLVAGSTARALLGFGVIPRDLDIELDGSEVPRAAAAIGLDAGRSTDDTASSVRAYGRFAGHEVDLTGGLTLRGRAGMLGADFALLHRSARPVTIGGRTVSVAPIEEQIARATVLADSERLERIAREAPPGFAPDVAYLSARLAAATAAR